MEFLININIHWPDHLSGEEIERLSHAERKMAESLVGEGILKRMWRVPGRFENWGLWEAEDATRMHEVISNLPVWPYMDVKVIPLAKHPIELLAV